MNLPNFALYEIYTFFLLMGSTGFDSEINRTVSMSSKESKLVKLRFNL